MRFQADYVSDSELMRMQLEATGGRLIDSSNLDLRMILQASAMPNAIMESMIFTANLVHGHIVYDWQ